MKQLLKVITGVIILTGVILLLPKCHEEIPVQARDYQIEVNNDSLYLFDGERKVGATVWGNSPLDSLILTDNY